MHGVTHTRHSSSQLKGWVESFLNRRGLTSPSGLPLYSYAMTDNELTLLSAVLAVNNDECANLIPGMYWAAGYCLFVSEKYSRAYDANWSWQVFDAELDLSLQVHEHNINQGETVLNDRVAFIFAKDWISCDKNIHA